MAEEKKGKRQHGLPRRVFRWCRIAVLVVLLAVVGMVIYVNQAGVPGFLREAIVDELASRGLDARFSSLEWRWHEGIVAENFSLQQTSTNRLGPSFSAERAALLLDMSAFADGEIRLSSVELDNGDFYWRISDTNLTEQLRVSDIQAVVLFSENDLIELPRFESTFKGMNLNVSGYLLNAQQMRPAGESTNTTTRPDIQLLNDAMNRVAGYLNEFQFSETPTLNLRFDADAADWENTQADLRVSLPRTMSRWGEADSMELLARIRPGRVDEPEASVELFLSGDRVQTPWGELEDWMVQTRTIPVLELPHNSSNEVEIAFANLETEYGTVTQGGIQLVMQALSEDRPDEMELSMALSGERFVTRWGEADDVAFGYEGVINRTNWLPIAGSGGISVTNVRSEHGTAASAELSVTQHITPENWQPMADEAWGAWKFLEPYIFDFQLAVSDVDAQEVQVESAKLKGNWKAPRFELQQLTGRLYDGGMDLSGDIDVLTRRIGFEAVTDWDFHALDHKWSERFGEWFADYQWGEAPHVEASGKLNWPDWNVYQPDWKAEVGPTLGISGTFVARNPSYKGVPGLEASSTFYLTNFIWHLPDLTVIRPEGKTVAIYNGDDSTKDYEWEIDARVNPHALASLFKGPQKRAFQHFTNHVTPHVVGTVRGRWRAHHLLSFECLVDAPMMDIRGQSIDLVRTHVAYTNRHIVLSNGEMRQSNHVATAEAIGIDFVDRQIHFTNVQGVVPPITVARAIGPMTAESVEPYVFGKAPKVSVNGTLGLDGNHAPTDLAFDIDGEEFSWWRFEIDQIAGQLHWKHHQLTMTNVTSRFYGGVATGGGAFTFSTNGPTEFAFVASLTNSLLQPVTRDVFQNTNNLAGRLSGELTVTYGDSRSRGTWDGHGRLHIDDALLWDIPIFAIFSPLLDAISPGLGSSQADAADANFVIINGTIISKDLEIKSTEISMNYQGSIDHTGKLNALMEARVMKDSGLFGPLISTVFRPLTKLFEYRLTGTLAEPKPEPIYIPKILLSALQPIKALGDLLTPEKTRPAEETKEE